MRISVDVDRCCGSGQCVLLVPEVFGQREEDGVVVVLDAAPPIELHEDVGESAMLCPTSAIRLTED